MDETLTLDERIRELAEPFEGISVLVFFGSRARGTHRPDSDLDVAVLPNVEDSRARWHLLTRLAVALADLSPEGRVDVVFLDQANDILRQRVMEHGRVLINRDPEAWKELRVRTMREYGTGSGHGISSSSPCASVSRKGGPVVDRQKLSTRLEALMAISLSSPRFGASAERSSSKRVPSITWRKDFFTWRASAF